MCGCFFWKNKKCKEIKEDLNISDISEDSFLEGDIRPGSSPIIITNNYTLSENNNNKIGIKNMLWGFQTQDKKLIINARSESVLEKPLFYNGIRKQRCVIPAISFYEWNKDKIKVTFSRKDNKILYLAGFYLTKDNIEQFIILTTKANDSVINTHHRMPLFFEANSVKDWIIGNNIEEYLNLQMPELNTNQSCQQLTIWNL